MPRTVSRRTQDALLLSSLTLAVIVGKIIAASAQTSRLQADFHLADAARPLDSTTSSTIDDGETPSTREAAPACGPADHALQSGECPHPASTSPRTSAAPDPGDGPDVGPRDHWR